MANFSLSDAIKDKKTYPDSIEIAVGDGLKMTLGELRQFQEATGQDVAKQLEAERNKMAEEQKKLVAAQEEVVNLWTNLQAKMNQPTQPVVTNTQDWTKDPFFQPVADYLKANI